MKKFFLATQSKDQTIQNVQTGSASLESGLFVFFLSVKSNFIEIALLTEKRVLVKVLGI